MPWLSQLIPEGLELGTELPVHGYCLRYSFKMSHKDPFFPGKECGRISCRKNVGQTQILLQLIKLFILFVMWWDAYSYQM